MRKIDYSNALTLARSEAIRWAALPKANRLKLVRADLQRYGFTEAECTSLALTVCGPGAATPTGKTLGGTLRAAVTTSLPRQRRRRR
jgi:hypothetical protein